MLAGQYIEKEFQTEMWTQINCGDLNNLELCILDLWWCSATDE